MAEAVAISLSAAKLGMALSRSAAVGIPRLLGVRSDIAAAVQELDLLRAFLRFVDSRRGTGTDAEAEHVAKWLRQVRHVAFELEDVADEWSYLSGKGLARDCVNVKAWFALSRRLRKARERLCRLSADKEHYRIHHPSAESSVAAVIRRRPPLALADRAHFLDEEEVIGFAAHEKQLMELLLVKDKDDADQHQPRRALVTVVCGMGGVGKTTLVTRVYKQLVSTRRHFDCSALVVVSQRSTIQDLLQKMLKELHRDHARWSCNCNDAGADDYRSLVLAVRDRLARRRYLIVLDDVWEAHLWKELRPALLEGEPGSRVVITTRRTDVAMAAEPGRVKMLEPLGDPEAWKLFCTVAFSLRGASSSSTSSSCPQDQECPSHLKMLAISMLKRCGGLPLAIVSIGNLLALRERTEFAWTNARDSLVWDTSCDDLGIGEAASILNLSIDDLPYHLRRCFLSCSVFPEDLLIKRKSLLRKWVAQGFVEEQLGQRKAEDVADDYLDQIVQRNLMKVVERNEFGRVKRCVIHDIIRDLIINRSKDENGFLSWVNGRKGTMDDCNARIRHLVFDRCRNEDSMFFSQWATLRTFTVFGSELDVSILLPRFRLLTVLNLWLNGTKKLPGSLTNLHNLRYLGIRSTLIEELPKELGKLQKLQTLDAKLSMVQRLPSSIAKLTSLRHIIVLTRETTDLLNPYPGMAVRVPIGLENLTNLQTLKYVRAHKKMVRSLAGMEQMRSLELSGLNKSLLADLSLSISRMNCLLRLGLEAEADTVLDLESICQPPKLLQKLSLTGRLQGGKLPSWTSSLTSLVQLRLCRCQIGHDSLVLLAALPRLANLSLINTYQERDMVFVKGGYPNLRKLTLEDLPNLSHIEFREGCLANLRDLVIGQCMELTETPRGMEKIIRYLKNFELFGMPTEFVDKLKEQNDDNRYHNPATSDFYQAHRFLRCFRFVEGAK